MIISNQNTLIKIDIGDSHIVCFDISACCKGNTKYFKRLENILDHLDISGIVMKYFLSHNLSNLSYKKFLILK